METKKDTPQERYHKKHKKRFVIDCFDTTESDIIAQLEAQTVAARYIKDLIRKDMQNSKTRNDV